MISLTTTDSGRHAAAAGLLAIALLASLFVVPAVAAADRTANGTGPSFVVALESNGDATVTVTTTYDLSDADERAAFDSLRNDSAAREDAADRFESRLDSVAADAAERVDRSMTVTDAGVGLAVTDDGETGVVEWRATWTGLAAVEEDRLIVTEPFASGFTTEGPLTIVSPDGHEMADATPEPGEVTAGRATWAANTTFEEFAVTLESTGDEDGTDGSGDEGTADDPPNAEDGDEADGLPGFGPLLAGFALAATVAAAVRSGRR